MKAILSLLIADYRVAGLPLPFPWRIISPENGLWITLMADGGRSAALETASMRELEAQVKTCQLCRLAKTRTNAVPGEGNPRAEVMFIGEGPGYHEDKQGRPFVGAAGQFLNELLHLA